MNLTFLAESPIWLLLLIVVALFALIGWRAWILLRPEAPIVRATGTVLSAVMPFPVFLIVIVYHYAKRAANRPLSSQ